MCTWLDMAVTAANGCSVHTTHLGTTRRQMLRGSVVSLASLACPPQTWAASSGVIAGAIRWDAWYSRSGSSIAAQDDIAYKKFQYRAPAHCKVLSEEALTCVGSQEVMDREIELAARAGIKFWAFVWYGPESSLHAAWNLYQSSSLRNNVNWCGIVSPSSMGSIPFENGKWRENIQQWADYMAAPNYQKVSAEGSTKRPLLFLLWDVNQVKNFFGDLANMGMAASFLRERVLAAGLGPPYIVILHGAEGAQAASAIGAQAISSYIPRLTPKPAGTYKDLDEQTRAYWTTLQSTGKPIVPIAMVGWDTRPRQEHPGPFSTIQNPERYYALPSTSELATHISAAVHFIQSNPGACPSRVLLIYSWDECDEGGGLIPTLGDPAGSYLSAIAPTIR